MSLPWTTKCMITRTGPNIPERYVEFDTHPMAHSLAGSPGLPEWALGCRPGCTWETYDLGTISAAFGSQAYSYPWLPFRIAKWERRRHGPEAQTRSKLYASPARCTLRSPHMCFVAFRRHRAWLGISIIKITQGFSSPGAKSVRRAREIEPRTLPRSVFCA